MKALRAAVIQFEHAEGDKSANLATVRRFVGQAAADKVKLACFPECCITGYWFLRQQSRQTLTALAEPVPAGPASQELMALAREHDMIVGAGLIELGDRGSLHNTYVVALPNGEFHKHRKIHTFISPHMESGDAFTVFDTPHGWKVGVLTCYDNNIVENVRCTALQGADVIMAPHQTGGCRIDNPHIMGAVDRALWDNRKRDPAAIEAEFKSDKGRGWLLRWLPSRAHDAGLFYLFANGVGVDGDEVRTGNAMIIDPYGRILEETWVAADAMVVADLDPGLLVGNSGRGWTRTRRPELYGAISRPTGMEEDVKKVRFEH